MESKVFRMSFEIDASAGELPFRTFHSNMMINGKMFAVASKLTADNRVNFKIVGVDGNGPKTLMENTVPMDKFFELLSKFQTMLQGIEPAFTMIQATEQEVAITNHPLAQDGKLTKEAAQDMLNDLEGQKEENPFAHFGQASSNRIKKYM